MACSGDVEHKLVERFHTDDGELEGILSETAFFLGVQFYMFREELLSNRCEFTRYVHPHNVDRITKMCWNNRRLAVRGDSPSESYVEITVMPRVAKR